MQVGWWFLFFIIFFIFYFWFPFGVYVVDQDFWGSSTLWLVCSSDERRCWIAEAQRREDKTQLANRGKLLIAPASTAFKHSLKEVLALPAVASQIKDTMAAKEVRILGEFMAMLAVDSARAFYGPGHVWAAHELGAIQVRRRNIVFQSIKKNDQN
jgi:hypothetical protein